MTHIINEEDFDSHEGIRTLFLLLDLKQHIRAVSAAVVGQDISGQEFSHFRIHAIPFAQRRAAS